MQRKKKNVHLGRFTKEARIRYDLPRDKSSCRVCGNELNGKKHCDLCGAYHNYL